MNKPFRVTCFAIICAFLALCATWAKADDSREQEQVIQEFDVAKGGYPLVIPVTICGKQFGFELDSGSSRTWLDESLRGYVGKFLKKETFATPSGGKVSADL